MQRVLFLDNLKGIAFLLMLIHHIYYFYDATNDYTTDGANNIFVNLSGIISRSLFIILAGISVYLSYKKNKGNKKNSIESRINRSFEILLHGLAITLITYIYYPDYFVRFGVLHFIALGTFLVSFIVPYKKLTILLLFISLIIKCQPINNIIDVVTGGSVPYDMMDWFPLKDWMPLLLLGVIIGQQNDFSKVTILNNKNILTVLGKNSLKLYTIHVLILILIYKKKT